MAHKYPWQRAKATKTEGGNIFCIGSCGNVHTGRCRLQAASKAAEIDDQRHQGHRGIVAAM
jgi:hypothetical protein